MPRAGYLSPRQGINKALMETFPTKPVLRWAWQSCMGKLVQRTPALALPWPLPLQAQARLPFQLIVRKVKQGLDRGGCRIITVRVDFPVAIQQSIAVAVPAQRLHMSMTSEEEAVDARGGIC